MYGKMKNNTVPSDLQAREKLATYVYEYLLHVGAGKAAVAFLQEIGWDKNITVGESPGFLHQWWCVFWDLYCASPERRETCDHSTEAKVFHDYSSTNLPSSSLNAGPPDGLGQPGMPPGYFPPYMSPRYPPSGSRPGMQGSGAQSVLHNVDHPRQGQMMGMNRMMHPRAMSNNSMSPYVSDQFQQPYGATRMSSSSIPGQGGIPMQMPAGRWSNPLGSAAASAGALPSTTPILRSPPGHRQSLSPAPHPHRFLPHHNPQNSGLINSEYGHMIKPMPHQQMPSFSLGGSTPDSLPPASMSAAGLGQCLSVSAPNMTPGINGLNGAASDRSVLEAMSKSSPNSGIPMNAIGPGGPPPMRPPGGTSHTPLEGAEDDSFIPYSENLNNNQTMGTY